MGKDKKQKRSADEAAVPAMPTLVSKFKGMVKSSEGHEVEVDKSHVTTGSIMYDALFVPGGKAHIETQSAQGDSLLFLQEAFKHGKPIGATGEGLDLVENAYLPGVKPDDASSAEALGVVLERDGEIADFADRVITVAANRRFFNREQSSRVPA